MPALALPSRRTASIDAARVLACSALVVAVVMPLVPSLLADQPHDGQRLAHLIVLLGTGLAAVLVPSVRARLLRAWGLLPVLLRVVLGGVVAVGIASSMGTAVPGYAAAEVAVLMLSVALALVVSDVVAEDPTRALRILSRAAVAMVGGYAVLFLVSQLASIAAGTRLWPHAYTGFSNIRHLNHLQTWTYALVLLPALQAESVGWRRAALGLSALWVALAIGSGGRGTLLALGVGLVGAGMLMGPAALRHVRTVVGVAVAGVTLHLLLNWLPTLLFEQDTYTLARPMGDARMLVWGLSFDRVAEAPWLGVGPMQLAADVSFLLEGRVAHPHNAFVQVLAEWGGLAAALVVVGAGWAAWRWAVAARRGAPEQHLGMAVLTVALLGAVAHSMVSGVIVMPVSQLWGALVIGTAIGWRQAQRVAVVEEAPARGRSWMLAGLMGVTVAVLSVGVGPDALRVDERDQVLAEDPTVLALMPRFWRAGELTSPGASAPAPRVGPEPSDR